MNCDCSRSLTQQVLHSLCWLDDLCAHRGAADAIKGVIGSGDDLENKKKAVKWPYFILDFYPFLK